jgi:hypothetical protein
MRAFNKLSVALATTFALVFATAALPAQASGPSGFAVGDGTPQSPYEVGTLAELANVASSSGDGVYFKQTADLDLTGLNFAPLGTQANYFTGNYDGAGHTVKGILADSVGEGLFGYVGGGTERTVIENLNLEGSIEITGNSNNGTGILSSESYSADFSNIDIKMTGSITDAWYVGALSGYSEDVTISDASATGTLSVDNRSFLVGGLVGEGLRVQLTGVDANVSISGGSADLVGGILGRLWGPSLLTNSESHGDINIAGSGVGGAVGVLDGSSIEKTYTTGVLTSAGSTGGLVGTGNHAHLSQVFATGNVVGQQRVGGIAGQLYSSTVEDAYATGSVTADFGVGIIVGYTENTALTRTHGTGLVSGSSSGLIGDDDGGSSIADSFWFQELNAISQQRQYGNESSLTLAESVDIAHYKDANWSIGADVVDESYVWTMCAAFNDGIPFLSFAYPDACILNQVLTPTPTISGGSAGNSLLTATPGTWDEDTALTYSWYADDVEIADATSATYTPTLAQVGSLITVKVTSSKAHFVTVSKTSAVYGPIGLFEQTLKPVPTVSGNATVGSTLTATPGTWDADVTLTYQWLIDFVEIPGATSATYSPIDDQVGGNILVRVTATKQGYTTESKTSENNLTVKGALVTSRTYSFGGLKGDSWKISNSMKAAVLAASKANPKAKTLVCVGIVKAGGTKSWMKALGLKRAAVGCSLAKLANPKLKVSYKAVIAKPNAKIQRGFTLTFTTK